MLQSDLKAHSPARKTALSSHHQEQRLGWAQEKSAWDADRWEMVAFSDESKFCLGQSRVQFVRRPSGHRHSEQYVCSVPNRSVAHTMVWGAFSIHGFTDLVRIEDRLDAAKYTDVLHHHLTPKWHQMTHGNGIFQQDNAPIHTALRTRQFLQRNGINLLDWPAFSPDMNPIENVWGRMELKLQREYENPSNSDELYWTLQEIWSELMEDWDYRRSLVHSMVDRVEALLASEGGFTKY